MRDFNARKYAFLPAIVSPYGVLGDIINRFLFDTDAAPAPSLNKKHAERAWHIAISQHTPRGILKQASRLWKEDHPGEFYGSNYRTMDPMTSASQRLGQLVCVANGTHILHAIEKMNGEPVSLDDESSSDTRDWIREDIESDAATCPETHGYESLLRMSGDHIATDDDEDEPEEEKFESILNIWRRRETEARQTRDTCFDSSSSRNNTTDMSEVT